MKLYFALPLCLAALVVSSLFNSQGASAQEFTRSTIPLKSGGSITSIESQGQRAAYLNRDSSAPARTADARNALNSGGRNWNRNINTNNYSDRRETAFAQSPNSTSSSFYRQAQVNDDGTGTYPYPGSTGGANGSVSSGFNPQFIPASNSQDNGRADLRFDRSGLGERPSGALGDTSRANAASSGSSSRVAQLPQPPIQLPPSLPNPASALPNPALAVPTFGGAGNFNLGPNYVNPAANYATGYQGYQPQPQAANTVPALNIQMPQTAARNGNSNCCCVPQTNPCCAQQQPAGFAGYQGYQFQPNIGTPQFGRTNNSGLSSLFAGTGQYTPLIQFRNMPPGTYLGQGVIGQPTAYVDGQPIRNLLRYVSP